MITYEGKDHSFSIAERELFIDEIKSKTFGLYVYLQTCNRVELYHGDGEALPDTVKHLFRIASGLESKMLGEGHILGQVRRSYLSAIETGTISCGLHRLFQHAIYTGKRVRTETAISRGAVTHGQTTVSLLKRNVPDLKDKKVIIIGVNALTKNIVIGLKNIGCKNIHIVNRTLLNAQEMASELGVFYSAYNLLIDAIREADVVVAAIKTDRPVILSSHLPINNKMTIVDLAVPRNIDDSVQDNSEITLYNLDDVEKEMDQNIAGRLFEVLRAEEIIDEEMERYDRVLQKKKVYKMIM